MYCRKCGQRLSDGDKYCTNCGEPTGDVFGFDPGRKDDPYYMGSSGSSAPTDTGSFGWAVLGFFFPLLGLILYLVWKDTRPVSAKQAGKGALVGVVLSAASGILWGIVSFGIGLSGLALASIGTVALLL